MGFLCLSFFLSLSRVSGNFHPKLSSKTSFFLHWFGPVGIREDQSVIYWMLELGLSRIRLKFWYSFLIVCLPVDDGGMIDRGRIEGSIPRTASMQSTFSAVHFRFY
jgi:hypothetical protein